ncbi:MAG: sugar ABC transporter ATP-binding protein [Rhodothermales bacterium]|nr:sugar ABC transporter ATP-binding protein [Rhodothermales bacterium]
MTMAEGAPLLAMEGIEKSFPGVYALKGVRLDLHRGEVLAVVGENGAGKSTLIKVLAGVHAPDAGAITIDGVARRFANPLEAQRAGIAVIYQEFNLIPGLTVQENILLGHEKARFGFFSPKEERQTTEALFARMRIHIDPSAVCATLSVAQQQLVEIAKALSLGARILVMDEPSAALTNQEVDTLFAIIRDLQAQGIGIIYISHRLNEIFAIADRVTVLRDGAYIDTRPVADVNREALIEMMVGRSIDNEFPKVSHPVGDVRLEVRGLARTLNEPGVSFVVRRGEIVGLTGLVGAGRTELARLIFGADRAAKGEIVLDGRPLRIRSPQDAIRQGICLLTEDRKAQGLVLGLSSRENFALPNLGHWSRRGFIAGKEERARFAEYIGSINIKLSHQDQLVRNLSGGNQQKVLLARWLESNSDVIIFDEPTRGIDVGAKYEIYLLMNELARAGKAILMISSELPEVLGMSDRVLVMHQGRINGEIADVRRATQEEVMALAVA